MYYFITNKELTFSDCYLPLLSVHEWDIIEKILYNNTLELGNGKNQRDAFNNSVLNEALAGLLYYITYSGRGSWTNIGHPV